VSIWPKDKLQFGVGLLYVVVACVSFADRNSPYGSTWHHYSWVIWVFGSLAFFFNAYAKPRAPSE
jgi:hypothetical protein